MKKRTEQINKSGVTLSVEKVGAGGVVPPIVITIVVALISAIAVIGSLLTFVTILDISASLFALGAVALLLSVAFTLAWQYIKKHFVLLTAVPLGTLAVCGIFWQSIRDGAVSAYCQAFSTISYYMYWDEPKFDESIVTDSNPNVLFLLLCICVLLCLFVSYFLSVKKSIIAVFLLTFPFFEIGAAFGCVPDYFWFSLYLGALAAAFVYIRANKPASKRSKRAKKRDKGNIGRSNLVFGALIAAAATVAIFFIGRNTLNGLGFDRPENMDKLRHNVKNGYSSIYDYIVGEDHDGSLKEGKLLKVDDRKIKERHYLTLETSLQKTDEPIYLRGFNATDYTGTEWKQSESYESYKKLFDELKSNYYRISGINGSLLSNCTDYQQFAQARFTVSDLRRKKDYAYQTYCADFDDTYTEIYDSAVSPKSASEYAYNTYTGTDAPFKIQESRLFKTKAFTDLYKEYKQFVKKEYVKSTATESVKKLAKSFDTTNKYKMVDEMRSWFKQNIKHTYIVDKSPKDADFAEHFLFETKRGYSTHFATAAAVMLQAAGYPTRYVEGYVILPKQFNEDGSEGKYGYITYDVTDLNAHAWVEIFDDNFGWIPVEVTPGMYSGSMYDMMQRYENELGETDEPEKKDEPQEEEEPPEEEPQNDDDDGPDDLLYGEITHILYLELWQAIALGFAAFLIVAFVIWLIAARVTARLRKSLIIDGPHIKAVPSLYKYFKKLLRYDGVKTDETASYADLIKAIEANDGMISAEDARVIISICEKFAFSKDGIKRDEMLTAAEILYRCSADVYSKLKTKKRFAFKYINAM